MYSSRPSISCGANTPETLAVKQRIFELDTIARESSRPAEHLIEELDKIYHLKIRQNIDIHRKR